MTSIKLPPLNQLRVFESAARHLSFKRAAEELFVTAPAVSHQIKSLEEHLDVSLFKRMNRQLALTDAGKQYFAEVQRAIRLLQEATEQLHHSKTTPRFIINSLPNIAALLLSPYIHEFQDQQPDHNIEIVSDTGRADFDDDKLNVAIRHRLGEEPELIYIPLVRISVSPFCSESYLAQHPELADGDLSQCRLIRVTTDPYNWTLWLEDFNVVKPSNELSVGSIPASVAPTVNGGGLAMAYFPMFAKTIRQNGMVLPFPDQYSDYGHMYLVLRTADYHKPIYSAFEVWIKALISRIWTDSDK